MILESMLLTSESSSSSFSCYRQIRFAVVCIDGPRKPCDTLILRCGNWHPSIRGWRHNAFAETQTATMGGCGGGREAHSTLNTNYLF